jgi:hypothetical protein
MICLDGTPGQLMNQESERAEWGNLPVSRPVEAVTLDEAAEDPRRRPVK